MGLIDLFDRLISERGSALVQEKHIALIREQLLAADKKITSLNEEIGRLTGENTTLKTKNVTLQNKQLELSATIDRLTKENETFKNLPHSNLLDETKIRILQYLWKNTSGVTEDQLAHKFDLDIQTVTYHIEELEKDKMIYAHWRLPRMWKIIQKGREYLIENKLVS